MDGESGTLKGFDRETLAQAPGVLRGVVDNGDLSGAVTLIWRAGEEAQFTAIGRRDIEQDMPMERNTLFRIASMTKPVTSVAMMMLIEEGKAALTDPITKWAPEFANMRVLRIESAYAVRHLLPGESVEMFHLLFPDPWEKRRHHQRRIVGLDFLRDVHAALKSGGILRVVTDHREYFEQIQEVAARTEKFELSPPNGHVYPPSRFEEQFQQRGVEIHRLELRKISPVA